MRAMQAVLILGLLCVAGEGAQAASKTQETLKANCWRAGDSYARCDELPQEPASLSVIKEDIAVQEGELLTVGFLGAVSLDAISCTPKGAETGVPCKAQLRFSFKNKSDKDLFGVAGDFHFISPNGATLDLFVPAESSVASKTTAQYVTEEDGTFWAENGLLNKGPLGIKFSFVPRTLLYADSSKLTSPAQTRIDMNKQDLFNKTGGVLGASLAEYRRSTEDRCQHETSFSLPSQTPCSIQTKVRIVNISGKDIAAFWGKIIYRDAFGNDLFVEKVANQQGLSATEGELDVTHTHTDYAGFRAFSKKVIAVVFQPQIVIYKNGTRENF